MSYPPTESGGDTPDQPATEQATDFQSLTALKQLSRATGR